MRPNSSYTYIVTFQLRLTITLYKLLIMKFLYLTIVYLGTLLGLYFSTSALALVWGCSYKDAIFCVGWDVLALIGYGIVAACVVDEEARRIDWRG